MFVLEPAKRPAIAFKIHAAEVNTISPITQAQLHYPAVTQVMTVFQRYLNNDTLWVYAGGNGWLGIVDRYRFLNLASFGSVTIESFPLTHLFYNQDPTIGLARPDAPLEEESKIETQPS